MKLPRESERNEKIHDLVREAGCPHFFERFRIHIQLDIFLHQGCLKNRDIDDSGKVQDAFQLPGSGRSHAGRSTRRAGSRGTGRRQIA